MVKYTQLVAEVLREIRNSAGMIDKYSSLP